MRVFKYSVIPPMSKDILIRAPWDAEPLSIAVQDGEPVMYMLVEPGQRQVNHHIMCVGTGHDLPSPLPPACKFIGTALLAEGRLVLHYFYCGRV